MQLLFVTGVAQVGALLLLVLDQLGLMSGVVTMSRVALAAQQEGVLAAVIEQLAVRWDRPDVVGRVLTYMMRHQETYLLQGLSVALLRGPFPQAAAKGLCAALRDIPAKALSTTLIPPAVRAVQSGHTRNVACAMATMQQLGADSLLYAMSTELLDQGHQRSAALVVMAACYNDIGTDAVGQAGVLLFRDGRTRDATEIAILAASLSSKQRALQRLGYGLAVMLPKAVQAGQMDALIQTTALLCQAPIGCSLVATVVQGAHLQGWGSCLGHVCCRMVQLNHMEALDRCTIALISSRNIAAASDAIACAVSQAEDSLLPQLVSATAQLLTSAIVAGMQAALLQTTSHMMRYGLHAFIAQVTITAVQHEQAQALARLSRWALQTRQHLLMQELAIQILARPGGSACLAEIAAVLATDKSLRRAMAELSSDICHRAVVEGLELATADLAHRLVLGRCVGVLHDATLQGVADGVSAELARVGYAAIRSGRKEVVWALTYDLLYHAFIDEAAVLGFHLAYTGDADRTATALVRPLSDLVTDGQTHVLAKTTALLDDRYDLSWYVAKVTKKLLEAGHGDVVRAMTSEVFSGSSKKSLAKVGAKVAAKGPLAMTKNLLRRSK